MEAIRQRDTYITDGGSYGLYQRLIWQITSLIDTYIDVTISITGFGSYTKRLYAEGGAVDVVVWDVLGELKSNTNSLLPASEEDVFLPGEVELSYTDSLGSTSITISVFDSLASPDSFIHSKRFLTVQPEVIKADPRFEGGVFHYGQRTIELKTESGFFQESGTPTGISFVSFRNPIGETLAAASMLTAGLQLPAGTVVVSGFGVDGLIDIEPANCTIYGDTEIIDVSPDYSELMLRGNSFFAGCEIRDVANNLLYSIEFATLYQNSNGLLGYCSENGIQLYCSAGGWAHRFVDGAPLKFIEYGGYKVTTGSGAVRGYFANNADLSNILSTNPEIIE